MLVKRVGLFVIIAVLLGAACGSAEETPEAQPGAEDTAAASCEKESLPLLEEGQLTIATDKPAYPPWFEGNDPSNGKGFEGAVAYAVAEEMGFTADEVTWVVEPFNKSYAPGPKDFDFDINQISISPKRDEAVDFSTGYYTVNQALVALKGSSVAGVASLEDLKDHKLGAQVGTTSFGYIQQYIQPSEQPFAYDNTNDAKSALRAEQIDGIVVDLPTAFFITAVEIPGSEVVGQFVTQGEAEEFGLLFEDGSPLVDCVNQAIQSLTDDGTLAEIQDEWLSQAVDAPVIE
ncbi:MAG TPA: ABC transporter substrate-binding protein [Actinomycetota bacterium]|nr:ABC transporter substrate-binding protein [Actinomycetota bacterium]